MRFTYDSNLDALSVLFSENEPVIQTNLMFEDKVIVEIDGDGEVCRVQINRPSNEFESWNIPQLILMYPRMAVLQADLLIRLSERKNLFSF